MRQRIAAVVAAVRDPRSRASRLAVPLGLAAALVLSVQALPNGMPAGLYGTAIVFGAQLVLGAIGVLLIYRSDRIINFAQIQLGALGGVIFFQCVKRAQFIVWGHAVCPPCFKVEQTKQVLRGVGGESLSLTINRVTSQPLLWLNFFLSLLFGLAVAVGIAWLVRVLIIHRFRGQPPLIGTVATLGVVQVLTFVTRQVPPLLFETKGERRLSSVAGSLFSGSARPPGDVTVRWAPSVFHIGEILTIVVTASVIVALAIFLRRSKLGTGVRAAADNTERASTLGMDPERLSSRVWILAGLLSGVAAVLGAMTTGAGGIGGISSSGLLRILAAVVIAGMESIPIAIAVVCAFAIFDQGFLWSFGGGGDAFVDVVVLGLLVATLLLRRARAGGRIDPEAAGWRAAEEARPIPRQLRDLKLVRKARRAGPIVLSIVLLAFPWVMSPSDTHQGTVMLFFAMVGLSLLVLTGWAGQISLGQFAFAGVGGYVAAIVGGRMGWPLPVALLFAGVAGTIVALIVGLPALRIRGLYLAVTTLGFAIVTSSVLLSDRYAGRALPANLKRPVLLGLDTGDERVWYYLTLIVLAGLVVAVVGMRRGRTARALIACRDNERAAQSLGINLVRARLEAFAVSGFIAAFAGALFAYHQEGVASGNYSVQASLNMFLLAVIGGLGSVAGPLLGALYVGGLSIFARTFADLGTGLLALTILMFSPAGLTRIAYAVRDATLRRVAERYRVALPSMRADAASDLATAYRVPIAPKVLPSGGEATVPVRYRLNFHRPKLEASGMRKERRG